MICSAQVPQGPLPQLNAQLARQAEREPASTPNTARESKKARAQSPPAPRRGTAHAAEREGASKITPTTIGGDASGAPLPSAVQPVAVLPHGDVVCALHFAADGRAVYTGTKVWRGDLCSLISCKAGVPHTTFDQQENSAMIFFSRRDVIVVCAPGDAFRERSRYGT